MKMVAIIQARMSSSRLPGKVLMPILGQPMLQRLLERINFSRRITKVVVATSVDGSDDPIEELCESLGAACFRGSLEDVLDRYYQAAMLFEADHIIRLTADCPLMCASVVDTMIDLHLSTHADYTTNCIDYTLPDGVDVSILTMAVLKQVWQAAEWASEREHVVLYIHNHLPKFKVYDYRYPVNYSHKRWTVDYEDDLTLVRHVYEYLYPSDPNFKLLDIITLFEKYPELEALNANIPMNEGLVKSIENDKKVRA